MFEFNRIFVDKKKIRLFKKIKSELQIYFQVLTWIQVILSLGVIYRGFGY